MKSVDLVAKLLATENLTVIRDNVQTASFDVGTRELTLPIWNETMTSTIEDMLMCHEVGHALYTTEELFEPIKDNPNLHSYMNVVEDARIERLMMRRYPGIRKVMSIGYKELNDMNFFDVEADDVDSLLLIDRINLYFKANQSYDIKFTEQEYQFVERAKKTETVNDVIKLAIDIYEFSKAELKNQSEPQYVQVIVNSADNKQSDSHQSSDSSSSSSGSSDSKVNKPFKESDLASVTESSLRENLKNKIDNKTTYGYHKINEQYDIKRIVSFKTILNETGYADTEEELPDWIKNQSEGSLDDRFNKFKDDTTRSVGYLIKEFEMRKAATSYKRNHVSKSGSLDMSKIWGYQLNDDLFKRITVTADGKNHGMLFLLDWSGSMKEVMHDTLCQIIQLATFCQRVQIPYQVLAFSNYYRWSADETPKESSEANILSGQCTALLELFSHKMNKHEFNTMSKRLFNTSKFTGWDEYARYCLGGTPLNTSLLFCTKYIGQFINTYDIEKMTFITLTDGQGESLHNMYINCYKDGRYLTKKNVIVDPITKKEYPIKCDRFYDTHTQTSALLNIIKDRYNASIVGFYVTRNSSHKVLSEAMMYNGFFKNIDEMRVTMRKDGFVSVKDTAYDDLMMIPAKSLRIDEMELDISNKKTANAIAKTFTKVMSSNHVNKLLLNNFIKLVV